MSIEKLAAAAGMSAGNLSNIETGKQGYTQENLEGLAPILGCTPADLLERDPGEPDGLWKALQRATPAQREQIRRVVRALIGEC